MTEPDVRVPIKAWLKGPTFRALDVAARQRRTTVAVLLEMLADRAVAPAPPTGRTYVRITPELEHRIAELTASGYSPPAIARELRCSERSVRNHLPSEAGQ